MGQGRRKHRRTGEGGHLLARKPLDKKEHLKIKWGNFEI